MTTWLSQILNAFSAPFKWWIIIAIWERGLRIRLGKTVKELSPGIHLRIPWLDRIYVQSIRLRTISAGGQTISSKDGKVICLGWALQFSLDDIKKLYDSIANPEATLRALVQSQIAECIHTTVINDITPKSIEMKINKDIQQFKDWGLGQLKCFITAFAIVRTYRIINSEYCDGAGLWNIEGDNAGEKK